MPAAEAPPVAPPAAPVTAPVAAARAAAAPAIPVSQLPAGDPKGPPKPGSARDRMRQELEKQVKPPPGQAAAPPEPPKPAQKKPAEAPKPKVEEPQEDPADDTLSDANEDPEAPPSEEAPATEAPAEEAPTEPVDKRKPSPWKLVDQYKKRAVEAETKYLELEKQLGPETERKANSERYKQIEARNKELEDEIRYVNYSKSKDFVEKYQAPYEAAWAAAMSELNEIPVTDPTTQQPRAATAEDLLQLVHLPLGQAREVAETLFGQFANDVMDHRKEIKQLFEKQSNALKEAKEKGAERDQEWTAKRNEFVSQMKKQIDEAWAQVNTEYLQDPKYGQFFKPKEGDEGWNERLKKGFSLVDKAFSERSDDPKLTPEERKARIKRHAAVRNRAASWGALKYKHDLAVKRAAELEKELAQYKETTPTTDGTMTPAPATNGGSARDRMHAALQARAKPM